MKEKPTEKIYVFSLDYKLFNIMKDLDVRKHVKHINLLWDLH